MINKNTGEDVDLVIVDLEEETLIGDAYAEAYVEVEEGEEVSVYLEERYGNNDLVLLHHCVSIHSKHTLHVKFREVGGMMHSNRNNEQIHCQALGTVKSYSGIVVMLNKNKPVQSRMRHEVHTHEGVTRFEKRKEAYDYVEEKFGKSSENDDLWHVFVEGSDWFGKDYFGDVSGRGTKNHSPDGLSLSDDGVIEIDD